MNYRKLFNYEEPRVAAATIIIIGAIVAALVVTIIAAVTAYNIKSANNTISVTGSARTSVVADLAIWTIHLETKTSPDGQQSGLDTLDKAKEKVLTYLKSQGMENVETPAAWVNQDYTYPQNSAPIFIGYTVYRDIIVRSQDVDKLSALANSVAPLAGSGYTVTTNGLQLTYQNLSETRVTLLSEAIKDAKARAEAIAKDSGQSVGSLKSSASGVVQVLPQGGIDVSDYGSYDTTSKNKDVMVTVRAEFLLK